MKNMQAYIQAIINLDMYIKLWGGGQKNKKKKIEMSSKA